MGLDKLAESRILDWRRRGSAPGRAAESGPDVSLEGALLEEARSLRTRARSIEDADERHTLLRRARDLEVRVLVILERTDRPLAARRLAAALLERG